MTSHDLERFAGPHHQALEVLCAKALERGDIEAAYRLADRRCRIKPLAEAHCFVLRAEALYRMGERAAALDDLEVAVRIAPDDLAANRRLLIWGEAQQQVAAAKTLIDHEHNARVRRRVVMVLRASGEPVDEKEIVADPRQLTVEPRETIAFAVPGMIPAATESASVPPLRTQNDHAPDSRSYVSADDTSVTVIVPVYADYEATRACLEGLVRELDQETHHRAIIINDASPDDRIRELIHDLSSRMNVCVLTNHSNLGFAGTVNRALREVPSGDIILLNADTIVPHGFIDRLSAAARSSPDIGTVTPLSNNGEFTSFPLPNRSNACGSASDIENLDRIAARVNGGGVVDIPNGIGFCLYITRSCLDAVGALSEDYHRGYLEDVDFCLRARQRGFRHVCATSIFVGHVGSRSFGKQKRSLVVRNLEIVERRFPAYRRECAVFIFSDPLKAARRAIEVAIPPVHAATTLLVSVNGTVAEIARERARQLLANGEPAVLIFEISYDSGHIIARLQDAADAVPQSLEFDLSAPGPTAELLTYLQSAKLARMEFLDLARIPHGIMVALLELPVLYDIFIAHTELGLGRSHEHFFFLNLVLARANRLLLPDAQAEAFVSKIAPRQKAIRLTIAGPISRPAPTPPLQLSARRPGRAATRVGLVPIQRSPKEHLFIRGLISDFRSDRSGIEIVVAGSTSDDEGLLRLGGAFVTGPVDASELEILFRRYQFDCVVLCLTEPLFGHPVQSAVMTSTLPVAYLDWSRGRCAARTGDFPLDPLLSAANAAARLTPWLKNHG